MAVWVLFAFSFYSLSVLNVYQLKQEQEGGLGQVSSFSTALVGTRALACARDAEQVCIPLGPLSQPVGNGEVEEVEVANQPPSV